MHRLLCRRLHSVYMHSQGCSDLVLLITRQTMCMVWLWTKNPCSVPDNPNLLRHRTLAMLCINCDVLPVMKQSQQRCTGQSECNLAPTQTTCPFCSLSNQNWGIPTSKSGMKPKSLTLQTQTTDTDAVLKQHTQPDKSVHKLSHVGCIIAQRASPSVQDL